MITVLVNGANGRLGQVAVLALEHHPDFKVVATLGRQDNLAAAIVNCAPDVVLDVTTASMARRNAECIILSGSRPVIGTSGLLEADIAALSALVDERRTGGLVVPNFSISAALMMRFAVEAARYFPRTEIVEYHHDRKEESPSGTALATATAIDAASGIRRNSTLGTELLAGARGAVHLGIPIHSVRLPSLGAHQEVLFSGDAELLTIRSDAFSGEAYRQGILLACKRVTAIRCLQVGLSVLL